MPDLSGDSGLADRAPEPMRRSSPFTIVLRIGLVLLVFGAALLTALTLTSADSNALPVELLGAAVVVVPVTICVCVMARWAGRRRIADIGMTHWRSGWWLFLAGVLAWLVPAVAAFAALTLVGAPVRVEVSPLTLSGAIGFKIALVLLIEAFPEELVFRGYISTVLAERLSGWPVILVQSALFAGFAVALGGYTGIGDVSLFIAMGVGLGYLRMLTGTIWICVGFHLAFQTVSQLLLSGDVMSLDGSRLVAMIALGAVPFAVGIVVIATLVNYRPALLRAR